MAAPLGISRARTRSLGPSEERDGAGRRWRRGGPSGRGAVRKRGAKPDMQMGGCYSADIFRKASEIQNFTGGLGLSLYENVLT